MTRVRVIVQAVSIGLFLFFMFITSFSTLKGYPVSLFLEVDPLVAIATTIATHRVYQALVWSLVLILPTLLLGRFFCNWICPMGIILQFTGWLFNRRSDKDRLDSNRYRPFQQVKYYILVGILIAAAFGSLQNGLLDPIPTIYRSFTTSVLPTLDQATGTVYVRPHQHQYAWLAGGLFVFFLAMNLLIPRFFCRTLCPLGALLGWLSRFSLFRIHRNLDRCTDCDLCLRSCEGASDPHSALRQSECFVCFNCIEDCPEDALTYSFFPTGTGQVREPDLNRRRTVFAVVVGGLFAAFARGTGDTSSNFRRTCIRPPGSVAEPDFLERCIKCDQCIRVCPTNVLQPALYEAGLEGLWTPVMNMRMGYCELNCTLCGQVCPTGAIQKISIAQKRGEGEWAAVGPVVTGMAFYNRGRCLPWAMDTACVVCEEVCPVSPKAIFTREYRTTDRWGKELVLRRPYIDPELCIGCGICEHECPVVDDRAVYVTAVGESRSKDRSLLLNKPADAPRTSPPAGEPSAAPVQESRALVGFESLTDLVHGGGERA
ncbi:MAG: 4Fe-4S dicluster domain-containing protein [Armatimonadetes bacterium]|nr:4Fe-4S dicluster domain-containing protein [Armatimonadota bacterium]